MARLVMGTMGEIDESKTGVTLQIEPVFGNSCKVSIAEFYWALIKQVKGQYLKSWLKVLSHG